MTAHPPTAPSAGSLDRLAWTAARESAVLCDLAPLAVLSIAGADAATFLQGQLSNDVKRLASGQWQATTFNSPKGRVLANFLLWREDNGYGALIPQDVADSVRKRLSMYVLRSKVTLADVSPSYVRHGMAGPTSKTILGPLFAAAPAMQGVLEADGTRILGLAGERFVILTPVAGAKALLTALRTHAAPAPFTLWQWLAIRAGEPMVTAATQDQFVLQAVNLDALDGVSFDKGCYTGQEIIARTQYLGRLKERLFGWHASVAAVEPGARLYSHVFGDQSCGMVVNAAPGPDGGVDLLAVAQIAAAEAGDVRIGSLQGPLLEPIALPYAVPQPSAPPRRLG